MTSNHKTPYIQFNFHSTDGADNAPLLFSNPIKIISTTELDNVQECLTTVEELVNEGYYAAGYLSYEVLYAFNHITKPVIKNEFPLLWFGIFSKPIQQLLSTKGSYHVGDWKMLITTEEYTEQFNKILQTIKAGRAKQINYTVPFEASFNGDSFHFYNQLQRTQQAHYCCYLDIGDYQIVSTSPEMFFQLKHNNVTVRPMKGTIHRGKTYEEDQHLKNWLQHSEKNKLENQLIRDLMEKELSLITQQNSIYHHDTYRIEQYPTVYQMTSSLTGKLKPHYSAIDILKQLFPCGSISGVPKENSLHIIHHIEKRPREVYCGAIGYITPENEAVFNVPIRTVQIHSKKGIARYDAGGAITKYSHLTEEYNEVLTKTNILRINRPDFSLLETMAIQDGSIIVLEEHVERLKQSAAYFNIPIRLSEIQHQLDTISKQYAVGVWRIRLTVAQNGQYEFSVNPLKRNTTNKVRLAEEPIDKNNLFFYHKTTHRSIYDIHRIKNIANTFDVLLWNNADEITEFTIGNIVVELHGELYTPPISCGLLPGTYRKKLLKDKKIKERVIKKEEISKDTNIWLINSVREWVKVQLV